MPLTSQLRGRIMARGTWQAPDGVTSPAPIYIVSYSIPYIRAHLDVYQGLEPTRTPAERLPLLPTPVTPCVLFETCKISR
jgi:hypothetical protein